MSSGEISAGGAGKATESLRSLRALMRAESFTLQAFERHIEQLAPALIESADIVVSAVDSVSTRRHLARWCRLLGLPLVEGGFSGSMLNVSVYSPDRDEACYGCLTFTGVETMSCTEVARRHTIAEVVPTLQSTAAVAAGLVTELVVEIAHDRILKYGHQLHFNIRGWRRADMIVERRRECALGHEPIDEIRDLAEVPASWDEFHQLLRLDVDVLLLPAPLVRCALCPICQQWVTPNEPDWLFYSRSECNCSTSGLQTATGDGITQIRYEVERRDLRTVALTTDPAWLGLRPGGRVVVSSGGRNVLVRLPGADVPDEMEVVDAY